MAHATLDAFVASVGVRAFDLSILDINGNEVQGKQRPNSSLAELRRALDWTLHNATRNDS